MYALEGLGDLGRRASSGSSIQKLQKRIAALQRQISEDTAKLPHLKPNKAQKLQAKIDQLNIKLTDLQTQLANLQAGVPPPVTSTTTTPLDTAQPYGGDTQTIQPVTTTTPSTTWMTSDSGAAATTTQPGATATTTQAQPVSDLLSNPWILGGAAVILFMMMRRR